MNQDITANYLKSRFQDGDLPSGQDFSDLIDATYELPPVSGHVGKILKTDGVSSVMWMPAPSGGGTTYYPFYGSYYDLNPLSQNFISFRKFGNSSEYVRPGDIITFISNTISGQWYSEEEGFSFWLSNQSGSYVYADLTSLIVSSSITGSRQTITFSEDVSNRVFVGDNTIFGWAGSGSASKYNISSVVTNTIVIEFVSTPLTNIIVSGVKFASPQDFSKRVFTFYGYGLNRSTLPEVIIA